MPRSSSLSGRFPLVALLCLSSASAACGDGGSGGGGDALELTMRLDEGPYTASGKVTLPAAVKAGVRASLMVKTGFGDEPPISNDLDTANAFENTTLSGGSTVLPFTIRKLSPGKYFVAVIVDQNGDLEVPNAGDFGGFYAGTAAQPIKHGGAPTVVEVKDKDLTGLDFHIAEVTCLAAYGESCTTDDDCRGTVCAEANGVKSHISNGTCFENKCREAPQCPEPSNVKSEGSCLGGF